MSFNPADYEPVETRLARFWADYPDGRVETALLRYENGDVVVHAAVYRVASDDVPAATGHAQETVGSSGVNRTSAVENCETSAIGRALANLGYATKGKRPSREEMMKVDRASSSSTAPPAPILLDPDSTAGQLGDALLASTTLEDLAALAASIADAVKTNAITPNEVQTLRTLYANRKIQLERSAQ